MSDGGLGRAPDSGISPAASAAGMKVFVSYSRDDIDFALDLRTFLDERKFDVLLDQHGIDANDDWQPRLGALIASCDTAVFVLTKSSASSGICAWEVQEAVRLGRRILVVAPRPADGAAPPEALGARQWIACYRDAKIDGSGLYAGFQKLERALKTDLDWLRQHTWLHERANEWHTGEFATEAVTDNSAMLLRGAILTEAERWATQTPAGSAIQPIILQFLEASRRSEDVLQSEARARLAEREQALKAAESAVKDRESAIAAKTKTDAQLRWLATLSLVVGVLLVTAALVGGWFAAANYADASVRRAALFAREANDLSRDGNYAQAVLMALYGNLQTQGGVVEQVFKPKEAMDARNAVVRNYLQLRQKGSLFQQEAALVDSKSQGWIHAVAFSPDGSQALTSFGNNEAALWRLSDRQRLVTFSGHTDSVGAVGFSADGAKILTASRDRTAKIWSPTGKLLLTYSNHQQEIVSAVISADGTRALTGSNDGTARLWNTETGEDVMIFKADGSEVWAVALSPDGTQALTGSNDKTAKLWEVETGKLLNTFKHEDSVRSVAFSPDGRSVLTGSYDQTAKLWRTYDDTPETTYEGHKGLVNAVAFSADGAWVITGSSDNTARLYSRDGTLLTIMNGHKERLRAVAISPNGEEILTGAGDGAAMLWGTPYSGALVTPVEGYASFLAASDDGAKGLLISENEQDRPIEDERARLTKIMDLRTGKTLVDITAAIGETERVEMAKFSPDGSRLVVIVQPIDGNAIAKILSVADGAVLATLKPDEDDDLVAAFSPLTNKVAIAAASSGKISIWTPEGDAVATFDSEDEYQADPAFSPDEKTLLVASETAAKLLDVATGKELAVFTPGKGSISRLGFSPDGTKILTGLNGETRLWPAAGGRSLVIFTGPGGQVTQFQFSADGTHLITSTGGGQGRLWSTRGGAALMSFDHAGSTYSANLSADGTTIEAWTDGGLRRWKTPPIVFESAADQVRTACDRLKEVGVTEFTPEEFDRFEILDRSAKHPCEAVWGKLPAKAVAPPSVAPVVN